MTFDVYVAQVVTCNCVSLSCRSGFLFVIVINQGFNAVTAVVSTFPREKLIVNRYRSVSVFILRGELLSLSWKVNTHSRRWKKLFC
jgi:hypothetical protein